VNFVLLLQTAGQKVFAVHIQSSNGIGRQAGGWPLLAETLCVAQNYYSIVVPSTAGS
jgi:hypothetical protein